jgi:CubicO group peptidase (beta-lactamase class C family)
MSFVGACARAPAIPPVAPSGDLAPSHDWSQVTAVIDSAIRDGVMPGAVLGVSVAGRRLVYGSGRLGNSQPARPDSTTLYDLASLTKVIGLTTAVMVAVDRGLLDLDAPIERYVPAFRGEHKNRVTIRHLLTHTAGLPAWRPLFRETASRQEALALADSTPLDTLPGNATVYSDLGAIVLTQAVEFAWGTRIDTILTQEVFPALGMHHTSYLPPAGSRPRIAAARLEGVSGHAGLFSTVTELLTFGEWFLAGVADAEEDASCRGDRPARLPLLTCAGPLLHEFTRRQQLVPGSSRALGWDTPNGTNSAGTLLSPSSFGHTGFTGTSIWIDPSRDLVPSRERSRIGPIRRAVSDAVVRALSPGR